MFSHSENDKLKIQLLFKDSYLITAMYHKLFLCRCPKCTSPINLLGLHCVLG